MRRLLPSVFAATCALGIAPASSDSLDDLLGPRELAVGEAMRASATGATSIGLNPAGLPLNRELAFEGGYGYRGSDSASLIGASACDSTNVVPGCFFYDYAGASPELGGVALSRTTHVAGATLATLIVPRISIGATAKYYRYSSTLASDDKASGFQFDAGVTVRLSELINVGVSGQNLVSTKDSAWFPRAIGGGVLARPIPMLALSFDSRWKTDGGAELFLGGGKMGYPVRAGAVHDTGLGATYVSAGLGVVGLHWGLDLGARRAVEGGDETLILASFRLFGPRLAAPGLE